MPLNPLRGVPCFAAESLPRFAMLVAALLATCAAHAFDLQGHRGTRGLMPENTLAAFARALDIGVTTLELDIAITADGIPVISHDPFLNPEITRDAQGRWLTGRGPLIKSLTLEQLQSYDVGRANPTSNHARDFPQQQARDGQKVPTLASLFALVKERGAGTVRFNIETKVYPNRPDDTLPPEAFVDTLLRTVTQAGMLERVMVQSFDWRTLQLLQRRAPSLPTVYLSMDAPGASNVRDPSWTGGLLLRDYASVAHMVKASGGTVWSPNFSNLDAAAVKTAHQLGLQVIPWTVNAPQDMDRLIQWGVDGIISDYPDRLREAMQRAGLPLPRGIPR